MIRLLNLLDDPDDAPMLLFAERPRFHDFYGISNIAAKLIVSFDLVGLANRLAIKAVLNSLVQLNDHGLGHLVG